MPDPMCGKCSKNMFKVTKWFRCTGCKAFYCPSCMDRFCVSCRKPTQPVPVGNA